MRTNLQAERKYEATKRRNRNEETKLRMRAKRAIEKSRGKLPKSKSVDHIKPLAKWWTNSISNLRVVSRKKNYSDWAKLKAKMAK